VIVFAAMAALLAAEYRTPAGAEPAARRPGATSILPGGRLIDPLGRYFQTGPGPFGLAVAPGGRRIVTADGGPNRFSLTVVSKTDSSYRTETIAAKRRGESADSDDEGDFRSVFQGLAFDGDRDLYASEGNSGRVRLIDAATGRLKLVFELNRSGYKDSYSGDLALDRARGLLFVLDQANFRMVVFDTQKKRQIASVRVGRLPFAIALSPDKRRAYVANTGMFEYRPVPGADRQRARETGLPFPAFGFPSPESRDGANRETGAGQMVRVPGLGDPNVFESNSLAVLNISVPARPFVEKFVPTGLPHGSRSEGGSGPSGVVATESSIFVSNANQDTISVINAQTLERENDIALRVPGLEAYRGVMPIGLALDPGRGWLLVAEAGINAVGVIDMVTRRVLGHLPAAWFPTRVAIEDNLLYVANAKGFGTGPNATLFAPLERSFQGELRRGVLTMTPLPASKDLAALTRRVWEMNGFLAKRSDPLPLPPEVDHVVLIVKENRTFDEVFGDIEQAGNGPVRGAPELARFGRKAVLKNIPGELRQRITSKYINVTPNHHALAERGSISDNFYADSEVSVDGHHWLAGSYPTPWTESTLMAAYGGQKDFRLPTTAPGRLIFPGSNSSVHPEEILEAGTLWHHLDRHGIPFRNFGEGFELAGADEGEGLKPTGARYLTNVPMPDPLYRNTSRNYPNYNTNIPDQFRATQFIAEMKDAETLPRFLFIHLPNDHIAKPRPEDGFPFEASFVADNDIALGRILEFLSSRPEWKRMAVFITEDDAQGGVDHIDSHRTVFLAVGPYIRKNYVSRGNTSFPSILKTTFRLLGIPPLNLYDATAQDLADCFTTEPDFAPYTLQPVSTEIFDPAQAREPKDPRPGPAMDDPRVLREQHRKPK
jgi:DNA-binding beta-propeller fold protein YncE